LKLFFFRGPNFGDELNEYLLPKIFPNFYDDDPSTIFLGIGSILFDDHPPSAEKIVFGAGFGQYTKPPIINSNWKIYCVRGPRTASVLKIDKNLVAGDSAILIKRFWPLDRQISHKFSFMPHWRSMDVGHWAEVAKNVGINLIDPRWPVERVLAELQSSETVIAEAMHGAITADALRIPWIALAPIGPVHRYKWFDWAEALDMQLHPQHLAPSSVQEALIGRFGSQRARWLRGGFRVTGTERLADIPFKEVACKSLQKALLAEPMLSSDRAMDRALDKLETSALHIKRDYPAIFSKAKV
jgi:succinoglycan biosynthesis protein ExoV